MNTAQLKAAAARLAKAPVAEHIARAAEIAAERRKVDDAIESGRQQQFDISRRIADARMAPYADPDAAADALLTGGEVLVHVDTIDRLKTEQAGVVAGMRRLEERSAKLGADEAVEKNAAVAELALCVDDLVPSLLEEAKKAAAQLAQVYASAIALVRATGNSRARGVAEKLQELLAECEGKELIPRTPIEVPGDILDLLKAGEQSISQVVRGWPDKVDVPGRMVDANLVVLGTINSDLRAEIAALRAG